MDKTSTGFENAIKKKEKNVLRSIFYDSENSDSSDSDNSIIPNQGKENNNLECSIVAFTSEITGCEFQLIEDVKKGISSQLWPASKFLCKYFDENTQIIARYLDNQSTLIELGAGVGLCGIYLASLGFKNSILTDLPEAIPLLSKNIELNQTKYKGSISATPLSWGDTEAIKIIVTENDLNSKESPLIIASDCVYWECLFIPFYNTLYTFVVEMGCTAFISHIKRWKKDQKFFVMCKKFMNVEVVKEVIEYIKDEDSINSSDHKLRRQISRIYKISSKII